MSGHTRWRDIRPTAAQEDGIEDYDEPSISPPDWTEYDEAMFQELAGQEGCTNSP